MNRRGWHGPRSGKINVELNYNFKQARTLDKKQCISLIRQGNLCWSIFKPESAGKKIQKMAEKFLFLTSQNLDVTL